ncbi:MAG: tryptophan halogenase family protein [Novosphingobium meiothermophilum]
MANSALAAAEGGHPGAGEGAQAPVGSVVIVGGGTAGWMTAAALANRLAGLPVTITLVESDEIGTVGVGEATVPHIRFFNARLGIDEADFMRRTNATFKLGIEFVNWGRKGDSYIHPFGAHGEPIEGVAFHHIWARYRRAGGTEPIEAFSLPVLAARENRFAHPAPDPASLLSTYSYAYQFDAALYAAYLRSYAEKRGVRRIEGRVIAVDQDGESGQVRRLTLDDGREIGGELFVDCSGFRGLLIEHTLKTGYADWSHWLPCNRAVAVPCASAGPLSPYTRATALDAGWQWRIPLQHRTGNGHVYCSSYISDEAAAETLLARLDGAPQAEPRFLRFLTGKRHRQWNRNVVAIGLSAGFLEPLESTSIHLIQLGIGFLMDLFPTREWDPMLAREYNRLMDLEYERVRDFLILHYHATERADTPFWNYVRTMPVPDSLAERMTAFRERGIVVNYRDGMFLDASWVAVYAGQGIVPRRSDPRAEGLSDAGLFIKLASLREDYARMAGELPQQARFLEMIGARMDMRAPEGVA